MRSDGCQRRPGTRPAGLWDPGIGFSWLWGLQVQDQVSAGWMPGEPGRLVHRRRPLPVSACGEGPGSRGIAYKGSNPVRTASTRNPVATYRTMFKV